MTTVARGVALLIALLLGCGEARALMGADPDAVTVQRYTVVVMGARGRCTGVVVAQDIVLTAAHCLEAGKLRVVASFRPSSFTDVAQAVPHPNYRAA